MGFLAEVCRGMQGGAISLLSDSIRRLPRAPISDLLPSMHQPGTAVCSPQKQHYVREVSYLQRWQWTTFCEPCYSEKEEQADLCPPWGIPLHSPVSPTVLWLWRLKSTVKDINSYRELSTAEMKHKACPCFDGLFHGAWQIATHEPKIPGSWLHFSQEAELSTVLGFLSLWLTPAPATTCKYNYMQ